MRLKTWDLIGAIAYTQALALFESSIVFSVLVVLAAFLPVQYAKEKFSSLATCVVFVTSFWFVLAHFNDEIIRLWGAKNFLIWGLIYLLSSAISLFFVYRYEIVRQAIDALLQRLSVLSYLYTSFGIVSIFIVVVRNI
jgi:hypothetical protein